MSGPALGGPLTSLSYSDDDDDDDDRPVTMRSSNYGNSLSVPQTNRFNTSSNNSKKPFKMEVVDF